MLVCGWKIIFFQHKDTIKKYFLTHTEPFYIRKNFNFFLEDYPSTISDLRKKIPKWNINCLKTIVFNLYKIHESFQRELCLNKILMEGHNGKYDCNLQYPSHDFVDKNGGMV